LFCVLGFELCMCHVGEPCKFIRFWIMEMYIPNNVLSTPPQPHRKSSILKLAKQDPNCKPDFAFLASIPLFDKTWIAELPVNVKAAVATINGTHFKAKSASKMWMDRADWFQNAMDA
jgi:hypothetical protein